jgi:hypothetical protein
LSDRERRHGPGGREVVEERNLQEPPRDQDEHVEVKRGDGAAEGNQAPDSGEMERIIGDDSAQQQDKRLGARRPVVRSAKVQAPARAPLKAPKTRLILYLIDFRSSLRRSPWIVASRPAVWCSNSPVAARSCAILTLS